MFERKKKNSYGLIDIFVIKKKIREKKRSCSRLLLTFCPPFPAVDNRCCCSYCTLWYSNAFTHKSHEYCLFIYFFFHEEMGVAIT